MGSDLGIGKDVTIADGDIVILKVTHFTLSEDIHSCTNAPKPYRMYPTYLWNHQNTLLLECLCLHCF